eukprot:Partr_v1_DN27503_c0_g1_i4_m30321 putative glycerol-3-phosphate dehydrogenase
MMPMNRLKFKKSKMSNRSIFQLGRKAAAALTVGGGAAIISFTLLDTAIPSSPASTGSGETSDRKTFFSPRSVLAEQQAQKQPAEYRKAMFWKPASRQESLEKLQKSEVSSDDEYDLLIIGGGATGTGVALDAATRGLKVALVERDDWSAGLS